jgi:hypothetical protein
MSSFDGEIKSGWNLPPGVFDNDPHFSGDEIDIDVDELKHHLEKLEEALGIIDDAGHFAWSNDLIVKKQYDIAFNNSESIYEAMERKMFDLKEEGWNI